MEWDVFISHAGEDKLTVAQPLTALLERAGLKVWLDANVLTLGDSLSRKIDDGLARSRYGVVILSENFFRKSWPAHELTGLVARQVGGQKVILPVWHEIDRSYVLRYSPTLADALAVDTNRGLEHVAQEIIRAVSAHGTDSGNKSTGRITAGGRKRKRWLILGLVLIGFLAAVSAAGKMYWDKKREAEQKAANEFDKSDLYYRRDRGTMDGYVVVSCSTCARPRAWVFHLDARGEGRPAAPREIELQRRKSTTWPMFEFLYPEDKPHAGSCIDVPATVCQPPYNNYQWKPTHRVHNQKARGPLLRLDLKLFIGGYELLVTNEGQALAQGINVDVAAWQPGSPGIEFYKSYEVRDLSPWADFSIRRVFGEYR